MFTDVRWRLRSAAQNFRIQYGMAAKYGYRRELLTEMLLSWVAGWLRCHVLRKHREKFATRGRCYRCGKTMQQAGHH